MSGIKYLEKKLLTLARRITPQNRIQKIKIVIHKKIFEEVDVANGP